MHEAMPMSYKESGLGKVYLAETTGPPLRVKENPETTDPSVVIELEDHFKVAGRDIFGIEQLPTTRIALHIPAARRLCLDLIKTLAASGDRVAARLKEAMAEIVEELDDEA
jgi:hypothetical protein